MKVVLIDANAIIYRSYHALPKLQDLQGRPIQAVYGLANIFLKFFREQKPEYIFALYDRPEPTVRHQIFKEYKATRPLTTEDLKLQISLSKKIFSAFKIPILEKIGYEADDLIATLKRKFYDKVDEIIILTGDLDTLQLVDEKTKVMIMQKGITETKIYSPKEVYQKYNLSPSQLSDYKALIGDPSDNIIGIPGIGPKTAQKLLEKYENLEKIIEAAEKKSFDPNLNKKILDNKEKLLFNKELVTLKSDLEIDENILTPYQGFEIEDLINCFQEFGFRSLIKRLEEEKKEASKGSLFETKILKGYKRINSLTEIKTPFFFYLDQDLIKINDSEGEIKILDKKFLKEVLFLDGEKYVFDLKNILKEVLKEDFYFDKKINLKNFYDLKLIFWLLNPEKGNLSLENIIYFCEPNIKEPLFFLLRTTKNLLNKFKELQLERVYLEIELPLVPVLARMELRGVKVDIAAFENFKVKLKEKTSQLLEEIYQISKIKFNPNSPKELREILFKKLKISSKGLQRTNKGEISTQEKDLLKIAHLHPIIPRILDYRKTNKILTTYTDSILKTYNPQTQRIYTNFNQTGAASGRIFTENPNLQNLPLEGELAQNLRKIFIPEENFIFLIADYSQIELRILAYLSQDENLISAFKNNLDIHSQTAKIVFGSDSSENRRKAKIINFGIAYGISPKGLAERLLISISEAQRLIERFYYFYPQVKKYKEEMINFARTYSYVETLFGRKRFLPEINYQSYREKSLAERIAVNHPIQGLAADIFKKALVEIDDEIYKNKMTAYLVLAIHDELILETRKEDKEKLKVIIKEKMENALPLGVPLTINIKESYSLAKE
jgi:DNA polymerase-1